MKKTLSFLLAFLMIVTMVPVVAITSFASTEPTQIDTWAELIAMEEGGTYELTANITPTGEFTLPITLKNITLNGNGYTVSGFAGANSLFTMDTEAGNTVTVQNLVVGATGETYTGVSILMTTVPAETTLTVDGVKVKGNLNNNAGGAFVGTSAGTLTIKNSVNLANVTGNSVSGMIQSATAGSITVTNCINEGVITGTNTEAAGVLARAEDGEVNMTVDGFSNYAEIRSDPSAVKSTNVAGVVAKWHSEVGNLTMKNILSTAVIHTFDQRSALTVALVEKKSGSPKSVSGNITIENAVALYNTEARHSGGLLFGHINTTGTLTVKNCVVSGMRTLLNPAWSGTAYTYPYFALGDDSATTNKDYSGNFYDVTIEVRKFTSGTNTTQTHAPVAFADAVTPVDSQTSTVLAKSDNGATLLADKAAVLSKLNEATYTGAFGSFKWADAEKSAIVQATPAIKGIQFGNVNGDSYSARLVATIQDTLYYENIGFEVTVSGKTAKIHYSANVYGTIYGNENGLITYTAQELGGEYVYGLVINNIPADDAVTLTIRTYAKDKAVDGEGAAIEYFGAAQTITIQNGALVEDAQ